MVLLQAWVVMATMSSTMEVLVAVAEFIYRLAMVVAASKADRSKSKLLQGLWPCATEVSFTDNVSVQLNLGPVSPTMNFRVVLPMASLVSSILYGLWLDFVLTLFTYLQVFTLRVILP